MATEGRNGVRLECGDAVSLQPWYAVKLRKGSWERCRYHGRVKVAAKITSAEAYDRPVDYEMHKAWSAAKGREAS